MPSENQQIWESGIPRSKNHLIWDNWKRTKSLRAEQDALKFDGQTFTTIFYNAMSAIFYDAKGKPGVLYRGGVHHHAKAVIKNNGGKLNGYVDSEVFDRLRQGNFKKYRDIERWWWADTKRHLTLDCVTASEKKRGIYGAAQLSGTTIRFNSEQHAKVGADLKLNADEMKWLVGATVIHELLHNERFSHPKVVDYTPGSDYACSFPFVAEVAVLRSSPYWPKFETSVSYTHLTLPTKA